MNTMIEHKEKEMMYESEKKWEKTDERSRK